jgi:hypothetical protein
VWGQLEAGLPLQNAGGADKLWERSWQKSDLSDENFRVRASFGGIVNTMGIDYLAVQVHYAPFAQPRKILNLDDSACLTFADDGAQGVTARNWDGATTFVNGVPGAALVEGWNHVATVSAQPVALTRVQLGHMPSARPGFPFEGTLDEVMLFEEALSLAQLGALYSAPQCAP